MLRSKHILLFILWLIGAQCIASQSVVFDSVVVNTIETIELIEAIDTIEKTINITDSIKLADAEFEAWLEKYAQITDSKEQSAENGEQKAKDTLRITDNKIIVTDSCLRDTIKRRDFVELVDKGHEAHQREKNLLIMRVMKSLRNKTEEVNTNLIAPKDTISQEVPLLEKKEIPSVVSIFETNLVSLFSDHKFLSSKDILSEIKVDTTTLTVNPLFLDWVLGVESAVSLRLDDSDSVVVAVRKGAKDYVRATALELYTYHKSDLPSIDELKTSRISQASKEKLLLNLDSLNCARTSQLKVDLPEISKWSKGAKFQVHVSQNYISSNWYKGGESNLAATFYAMGYFNYDNRKGLQWDNKAEWKLGLYGMASDSLRWLRVNEDLLRLNSKLGYKAFKNFYYTAEWDFQTSLFNTYKSNTYIRTSGPFSPIRMSLSLGMDYKWKSIISVFLSPLSYKLVYVADMRYKDGVLPEENIAYQVGITDGTRRSNQLGALVRTDFDYDFNESIGMEAHFSFFGNYVGKIKGVEIGCEVIGNFKINRFLSAKVSLYPRYDSTTVPADGGKPKMQFYELISLGFNYKL